jgi:hypothetical protein
MARHRASQSCRFPVADCHGFAPLNRPNDNERSGPLNAAAILQALIIAVQPDEAMRGIKGQPIMMT